MKYSIKLLACMPLFACFAFADSATDKTSASSNNNAMFYPPLAAVNVVKDTPFSAEEKVVMIETKDDGTKVSTALSSTFFYRDSLGRTRTERAPIPSSSSDDKNIKNALIIPEIYDPVAGFQYYLDAAKKVAHRFAIPKPGVFNSYDLGKDASAIANKDNSGKSNSAALSNANESLGKKSIEGLETEGKRASMTIPSGIAGNATPLTTTMEHWHSEDLKTTLSSKIVYPNSTEIDRDLTNIQRAEPDPKLFQPPAEYKIVDESGAFSISY